MQVKKDYTHEQIVEIAKRVFLRNGYSKTSMRDIAKGAGIGVSNGGVFNRLSADYALNDQLHTILGYDYFHADAGMFAVYKKNSELFVKLKYSF